jgi:putative sigma-54 modulation protein
MDIYKFTGRNLDITEAMKNYTEEKLGKLERFFDHIIDAKVIMSYNTGIVRAEESGQDTYAAVDKAVDKLERQLKKFKDRLRDKKAVVLLPTEVEEDNEPPQVVRVKKHVLRPMTSEDAAMEMEALGHGFYMFHNSETNLVSVIYLRQDGHYGILEPAK